MSTKFTSFGMQLMRNSRLNSRTFTWFDLMIFAPGKMQPTNSASPKSTGRRSKPCSRSTRKPKRNPPRDQARNATAPMTAVLPAIAAAIAAIAATVEEAMAETATIIMLIALPTKEVDVE
jgi:hypothetical protein